MTAPDSMRRMRSYLQLVATGPELSKSLNREQADDAINMILSAEIDPVQTGIFLIALRMKRETDDENTGALDALMRELHHSQCRASQVLAMADPFNGFVRGLPATPFLPAVLAACGLPAYIHGVLQAGPKYGVTPHMVFKAAGRRIDLSVDEGAARIDDKEIGWCYLDQAQMIPALHKLVPLRDTMVKRTCLSTLEVVLKPISGARATHLLTGFVHKAYPPVYAALARHAGFQGAALVRGVEGGCVPSLSQLSRYFSYHGDSELAMHKLVPAEVGVEQTTRMVPIPGEFDELVASTGFGRTDILQPLVNHTVELGLAALSDKPGPMHDSLVYAAAVALHHCGISDGLRAGADKARAVLSSGAALARFNAT